MQKRYIIILANMQRNPRSKDPFLIRFIKTSGAPERIALFENTIYIAHGAGGLEVIDITNPLTAKLIGYVSTEDASYDVSAGTGILFVADGELGLYAIKTQECEVQ